MKVFTVQYAVYVTVAADTEEEAETKAGKRRLDFPPDMRAGDLEVRRTFVESDSAEDYFGPDGDPGDDDDGGTVCL